MHPEAKPSLSLLISAPPFTKHAEKRDKHNTASCLLQAHIYSSFTPLISISRRYTLAAQLASKVRSDTTHTYRAVKQENNLKGNQMGIRIGAKKKKERSMVNWLRNMYYILGIIFQVLGICHIYISPLLLSFNHSVA